MLVPPVNTPACGAVIADGQVGRRGVLRVGAGSFETCMVEPRRMRSGNEGLPGDVVIRTPDRRLRVFVSSTLGELARGAAGGLACHLGVAADAGDVRGGGAAAPAAGAVPGVPGAKRCVRRAVLAAVRVGRPGHGDLGPGGGVRAVAGAAPAAVCQGAGARPRAPAGRDAGPHRGGGLGVLPSLPHARRAGPAGARRPGDAAERAVRRRAPPARGRGAAEPARAAPAAGGHDLAGRAGAGHRRGGRPGRAARRAAGDADRAGRDRQDPAGGGGGRAAA